MRILVTGAAGFVGKEVCRQARAEGHDVVEVDPLIHWDLYQAKDWNGVEAVIHLGAKTGVRTAPISPLDYYNANVVGTLAMLEECKNWGIKKFVLASTSSVYGARVLPSLENSGTNHPLSPYAASKKAAEVMAHTYHHNHRMDVSILRFFTVYGPNGRKDMLIPRALDAIRNGTTLHINGDGNQERDFTHVSDIARGVLAAVERMDGYNIFNLGSSRPVTINYVLGQLSMLMGKVTDVEYGDPHPLDVRRTWADITDARIMLRWEPQITLEDGLRECVQQEVRV